MEVSVEELRARDARLGAWLDTIKPGDIVTVRLNSTDTLTGKVYEAPATNGVGVDLCVYTIVLRHSTGFPGGSYDIDNKEHAKWCMVNKGCNC